MPVEAFPLKPHPYNRWRGRPNGLCTFCDRALDDHIGPEQACPLPKGS